MATINIANLTFSHKGDYDGSTAYVKNDVVYYSTNGNAYIAKQGTTGNVPTNGTYWSQFAAGSGGIWNAGLSLGSAGQAVKVNAAGNALEFGAISAGKILQVVQASDETQRSTTSQSYTQASNTLSVSLTPSSSSNKVLVMVSTTAYLSVNAAWSRITIFKDGSNVHGDSAKSLASMYDGGNDNGCSISMIYYDSPGDTNSHTYDVRFKKTTSSGILYLNADDGARGQIIAMEIEG